MSNEVTVVDDTKATTNFLAGDIVKDNSINIYDLSADERLLVGIFRSATPEEQEEILQSANDICGLKK